METRNMKERIREAAASFFISVTLINLAILVLGLLFRPEQKFGYEVFLYPLIYGLIGSIPGLIITTNKELTVPQLLIRKLMALMMIIVMILAFIFAGEAIDAETVKAAAGVAVSIVFIYMLVNAIMWMSDVKTARSMTEDLMQFQRNAGKGSETADE